MGGEAHGHAYRKDLSHLKLQEIWARQERRAPLADLWWRAVGGRAGLRVLDLGCGPGFFALEYAARVGPDGRVLATDVSPESLAFLATKRDPVRHAALATRVLDAAQERPPLEGVDVVFATDVLHHVDDPLAVLTRLAEARRPGTRLLVAEFDPEGAGEMGPPLAERIPADDLTAWLSSAGWRAGPVERQPFEHYAVLAR